MPWSPGAAKDDVYLGDVAGLVGREVVVTEKLDGENTTLYRDGLHARSPDSAHHPSRAWVKALHARIAEHIPHGFRVSGENLFARHSIAYDGLESFFYAFSVWDDEDRCLGWDATRRFARRLGLPVPKVLWRGVFDERALRGLRLDLERQEGYVVRLADGFAREAFPRSIAKWVRKGHVQTDEHWMLGPVVENRRGPMATLWDVRSGASVDARALAPLLGLEGAEETWRAPALDEMQASLGALGRMGDARVVGVLAAACLDRPRSALMTDLPARVGVPLARRAADLVGLHRRLHDHFPDESRRGGLTRMARAADLGLLHALARVALPRVEADERRAAREQIDWSELHAAEAGLMIEAPFAALRAGLREALAGVDEDAADRCWGESLEAVAEGRVRSAEEAASYAWRWRAGTFPRLTVTVGPCGSGKSSYIGRELRSHGIVSLDDLRETLGDRSDQTRNAEVLSRALRELDEKLRATATMVWDATSLQPRQRALPLAVARRRDALATLVVFLVPEAELLARNEARAHRVPEEVLRAQLERWAPPYPWEAHRTFYLDGAGVVADVSGTLAEEDT